MYKNTQTNPKLCYEYDNKGFCRVQNCQYQHQCLKCQSKHPAIHCSDKQVVHKLPTSRAIKRPSQSHQLFVSQATNLKQTPFVRIGSTPVKVETMCPYLSVYQNKSIANELKNGFRFGFYLHYEGPRISTNLVSVKDHPKVVKEKIDKEIALGRIAGPFNYKPLCNLRLSPIGVVAKKDGGWRLIHHLSYPFDYSVNDFIDTEACSVHYTSFDDVLDMIAKLGTGAFYGKMDVKSALG